MASVLNQTRVCLRLPPKVVSYGLWKCQEEKDNWFNYSLPRLDMQIALIFTVTQTCHYFFERLGLPRLTSQLVAGMLLSPAVIGRSAEDNLISEESIQVLGSISTLGYAIFLFLTGVKMDPTMLTKVTKRALCIGILSVIPPLLCSAAVLNIFSENKEYIIKALFLSLAFIITSFPVITCLLTELKIIINSELGQLAQSSAMVGDILGLFILIAGSVVRTLVKEDSYTALIDLGSFIAFILVVFFVLRPVIEYIILCTPEGKSVKQIYLAIIMLLFLCSLSLAKTFDKYMLLGPYILGLAIPQGPPLGSALVEKLETMINAFLLPLFATTCGMRIEKLFFVFENDMTKLKAMSFGIAIVVKFVVCLFPALYSMMPTKDAFALALVMSAKGIVDVAVLTFLHDIKIIDGELFCFMFFLIMFMASIVHILVKKLYRPSSKYVSYHRRNILDAKPNTLLQVLACIHVPDNVSAVINLMDSYPSAENPISVNVLHLVKLRGQANPIFISHQKRRKAGPSRISYSENVISSFNKFEINNLGAVSVNIFTAVSPPSLMLDDIITLAIDKLASLILLPFHRRWYIDGSIESDDEAIRTLNFKVLEKSPCSIGILVDRSNLRHPMQNPYISSQHKCNVAMIFLGGPDDREALTFAKRMAENPEVSLTVTHLTTTNNGSYQEWDIFLDTLILRDVSSNGCINFEAMEVKNGSETVIFVHAIVNQYDLIIVGRGDKLELRQTSGLKEWREFPELGDLGDLLVDCRGLCSVLVVQQKQQKIVRSS